MGTGNSDPARGRRSPADTARDAPDGAATADQMAERKRFLEVVDRIGWKARPGGPTSAELIRRNREQHLKKFRNR